MERLPFEVWGRFGLETGALAAVGCASKALKAASDDLLCEAGIVLRERESYAVLQQPRWSHLRKLHVKGSSLGLFRGPAAFDVIPDPVPQPMLFLKELTLAHTRLPTAGQGCWTRVFERAPHLESVSLEDSFGLRNYCAYVRHCWDLLATGAPVLKKLSFQCRGLVVYPLPMATWLVAASALAAADHPPNENEYENEDGDGDTHWLCRTACEAVLSLQKRPMVTSETLVEYVNTGKQLAMLPVDAPLARAELEDPDSRPFLLERMGSRAEPTLRVLHWSALTSNFDGNTLARFVGLEELDLTLRAAASIDELEDRVQSLCHLPPTLRHLVLRVEVGRLNPTHPLTWPPSALAHLLDLESLRVVTTYALPGIHDLADHRMGAGPSLQIMALETLRPPEECLEGSLEDLLEQLEDMDGLDSDGELDFNDHDEALELQDAIDTCKATGVGADTVCAAMETFPNLHFEFVNVRVWGHADHRPLEQVPRLSIRNSPLL